MDGITRQGLRAGAASLLAAALLARAATAVAGEPPQAPAAPAASATTVIRTAPAQPPAPPPAPTAELRLRAYDGFGADRPAHDDAEVPFAVDLGIGLTTCPDGNTEVGALDVGGWRQDVTGTCSSIANRGSLSVDGATTGSLAGTAATRGPGEAKTVTRCDPATWNCASAPAP